MIVVVCTTVLRAGKNGSPHNGIPQLKSLNRGTFGFVQLAHDVQNDRLVAIKFLERGDKVSKYVERELINHRLLVRCGLGLDAW